MIKEVLRKCQKHERRMKEGRKKKGKVTAIQYSKYG